jgi:hypothetical protein
VVEVRTTSAPETILLIDVLRNVSECHLLIVATTDLDLLSDEGNLLLEMQEGLPTVLVPALHFERPHTQTTIGDQDPHLPKPIPATLLADLLLLYTLTVSVSQALVAHPDMGPGRIPAENLHLLVLILVMRRKFRTTIKPMESLFSLLLDQPPLETIHMIALHPVVLPEPSVKGILRLGLPAPSPPTTETALDFRLPRLPEVASMDRLGTMAHPT